MATARKKTQYEIVLDLENQKEFKNQKPFKSIKAVHNFLEKNKVKLFNEWCGVSLVCSWIETHPDHVDPFTLGYRIFTLEDDGDISYNRFPSHEF